MSLAITVLWLALVAGVIWYYQRKRRHQADLSARRMDALLSELKSAPRAADPQAGIATMPHKSAFTGVKRPRVMEKSQALLYYLFRTGLPDHEIFPGLSLGDVVDLKGVPDAERLRRLKLELVVCTKQFEPLAAVLAAMDADSARLAARCLESAGIRPVIIDPARPPRHQDVRALVYGINAT
jgi:hypothetical protein